MVSNPLPTTTLFLDGEAVVVNERDVTRLLTEEGYTKSPTKRGRKKKGEGGKGDADHGEAVVVNERDGKGDPEGKGDEGGKGGEE